MRLFFPSAGSPAATRGRSHLSIADREISRKLPLLSRINLIHHMARRIRVPRIARIGHNGWKDPLLQQRRLLDRVDI